MRTLKRDEVRKQTRDEGRNERYFYMLQLSCVLGDCLASGTR